MHTITGHILDLLNDTSFPPIVMLDGGWGEGKTYFTKHTLIPDLRERKYSCVFFSLTGLSSIDDFKDRLLSSSYIKSEVDSDTGKSLSTIFHSIVSQFGGENGGTIASILNGTSGLVKESMLSRLSDKVIIIDDLDRVSDGKLSDLIIGECLQLSDRSNLKFLFIVNDEKSLANSALKEKVFYGIVKLNKSLDEAIKIAFSEYAWFERHRDEIEKIVEHKNLKNLRVLKRVSKKINEINKVLKSDESLNLDGCMTTLIKVTVLTMYYSYEEKLSEEKIWEKSEHFNMLPDEKNEKYKYVDLVGIHGFLTKPLISFLVGGSNWNLSLDDFGRLQKKGCPIDTFMFSPHINQDDESFERHLDALQLFVFKKIKVPFLKWFEASNFYHSLQSNEFLSNTRPDIKQHFDELFTKKIFDYSDVEGRTHRLRPDTEGEFIFNKYVEEKESYVKKFAINEQDVVFNRMSHSWKDVDNEIYHSHRLQPFFDQFSAQQLIECLTKWENSDILLFSDFVLDRYNSINIKTHLAEEIGIISELLNKVELMHSVEAPGRKKGALRFLKDNLSSAVKALNPDEDVPGQ
ncbi:P-loop NTPase fold protein [uncultured Paraglaciecola sp.]|uniref:P-loop NTPase fold protein n=1 Tax=uncultured Paraglaciecola sp. TaxID=1765024 RepID=UPI0025994FED|nr:P-loop NTPase fold protein [uncultured Paraglaciecola sp.]